MFFIRILCILFSFIFILSSEGAFAWSGNTTGSGINTIKFDEIESDTGEVIEKSPKLTAIEKNLQNLILEFAKIQWNNSLKNITQSFKKINPDTKSIIATYSGLQSQFARIKKSIVDEWLSDSIRWEIIIPYCDYMIFAIEKKKDNLE